jgi:trehalose-phosphatase
MNQQSQEAEKGTILSRRHIDAVIFDLDGVVTQTAEVHASAWKVLFDDYLRQRSERNGEPFHPFEVASDYLQYVDGKPRYEGVSSFLASRAIELPYGSPDNDPEKETICGLGNRKDLLFNARLADDGVRSYDETVALVRGLQDKGFRTAVISASRNARKVLAAAGLQELFEVCIDGVEMARLQLPGKPEPDIFRVAAERLGVAPTRAAVVEDALAGVMAGVRGGFALVIGVDRGDQRQALLVAGAHLVVGDLSEVLVEEPVQDARALPSALAAMERIARRLAGRHPAVFLDYDGVLTPIVPRPEDALLSGEMRQAIVSLAGQCPVAVVSGRDLADVRALVDIGELWYAGSHGFDIAGPAGERHEYPPGREFLPALSGAENQLSESLGQVRGAQVERKRYAVAVHYRQVAEEDLPLIEQAVKETLDRYPNLRQTGGKKIFELRPQLDWDKGRAVAWLEEELALSGSGYLTIYIGDDLTDEDAFRHVRGQGLGILVRDESRPTLAHYALEHPGEVREFLKALAELLANSP